MPALQRDHRTEVQPPPAMFCSVTQRHSAAHYCCGAASSARRSSSSSGSVRVLTMADTSAATLAIAGPSSTYRSALTSPFLSINRTGKVSKCWHLETMKGVETNEMLRGAGNKEILLKAKAGWCSGLQLGGTRLGGTRPAWPECAGCSRFEGSVSGVQEWMLSGSGSLVASMSLHTAAHCVGRQPELSAHARESAPVMWTPGHRRPTKDKTAFVAVALHCTCGLRRAAGRAGDAAWPRLKPAAAQSACNPSTHCCSS
jgi:hypothetical protein